MTLRSYLYINICFNAVQVHGPKPVPIQRIFQSYVLFFSFTQLEKLVGPLQGMLI